MLFAGAVFGITVAVWCWSMRYPSAANGTLIANGSPIFVSLGARLLLRERFTRRFLFGLGLSIGGVVLLMGTSARFGGEQPLGDLLALGAALHDPARLTGPIGGSYMTDGLIFIPICASRHDQ